MGRVSDGTDVSLGALTSPRALQTGSQGQTNEEFSEEPPPTALQARDRFQASGVRVQDGAPSPAALRAMGQLATLLSLLQGGCSAGK